MKKKLNIPIIVLLEKKFINKLWADFSYKVKSIHAGVYSKEYLVSSDDKLKYFQLDLVLNEDECVNYYYNLLASSPKIMVVCEETNDRFGLRPILLTADFDYANAHLEVESDVYLIDIPKDIHSILEKFVIDNYNYEKRKKRKRTD